MNVCRAQRERGQENRCRIFMNLIDRRSNRKQFCHKILVFFLSLLAKFNATKFRSRTGAISSTADSIILTMNVFILSILVAGLRPSPTSDAFIGPNRSLSTLWCARTLKCLRFASYVCSIYRQLIRIALHSNMSLAQNAQRRRLLGPCSMHTCLHRRAGNMVYLRVPVGAASCGLFAASIMCSRCVRKPHKNDTLTI